MHYRLDQLKIKKTKLNRILGELGVGFIIMLILYYIIVVRDLCTIMFVQHNVYVIERDFL